MLLLIFITLISGFALGSFLNVCIYRIPRGMSVVKPRSRCPSCLKVIAFYDNIPVISYLLLRGRCRNCSSPIPWKYPAVEILASVLTLGIVMKWHGQWLWMAACLIACCLLIVITFIDIETFLIPDELSGGLVGLGLLSSFVNPYFQGPAWWKGLESVIGGVAGFVIMWILAIAGEKLFKKEAMGGGDLKFLAGIGTLLGWQGAVSTLMLGSVFGSVYGVSLILLKKAGRSDPIPFGPFLAAGALINIFIGGKTLLQVFIFPG